MYFQPGSIIKRPLEGFFYGMLYDHMGIYIGNNEVIHFNGHNKKDHSARIRVDSVQRFAAGQKVALHAAPKNRTHGSAVCKKAKLILRNYQNGYDGKYGFATNNCEDFCIDCYEVNY